MNYIVWALVGMAGYSATTLFVKLATRSHELPAFSVLAVSVSIVTTSVWCFLLFNGGLSANAWRGFSGANAGWSIAAGIALAIAVSSLFQALALGPANVVVPIYGMFILGGSALGVLVLREPLTISKIVGFVLAAVGVVLIAR